MAAGKLGKAGSTTRELTGLNVTLGSNAVAGRLLLSFFTLDWSFSTAVDTGDGWRVQIEQQGGRSPDLVTLALASKVAHGGGDARDTCEWSIVGGDDSCAAAIVEMDDDFGAGGAAIATVGASITSVGRSLSFGSLRAAADGIAVAVVAVSDVNNWDASGSSGPLASWSNSFTELASSYTFGGDGVTTEDAGLSIATKTVRSGDTVTTVATQADGSGTASMAAGILAVLTPAPVPGATIAHYDGSSWTARELHLYDGSAWRQAAGLGVL